jgi:hypothetical protein
VAVPAEIDPFFEPGEVKVDTDRVAGDGEMRSIVAVGSDTGEAIALWSTERPDDVDGTEVVERKFRMGIARVTANGRIKSSRSIGPESVDGVSWSSVVQSQPATILLITGPYAEILPGSKVETKSILEAYTLTEEGGLRSVT